MERLTYKTELGVSIDKNEDCPSCSICWNCNIPPRECNYISDALKKLADYEDLEEHGLLLRLPYPLGTEYIYFVDIKDREVYKLDAKKIEVNITPIRKKILYTIDSYEFLFEDFEKSVFLTKSEAETRLKELYNN